LPKTSTGWHDGPLWGKSKSLWFVAADAIFEFDRVLAEGSTTAKIRLMLQCLRYADSNPMKIPRGS